MLKRIAPLLLAIVALCLSASAAGAAPTAIETGEAGSCYIDAGVAYCWTGSALLENWLGDGPITKPVPTHVAGLTSGVTDISLGSNTGCAAVAGAAKCWASWLAVPAPAGGLTSGVTAVASQWEHSCAVANGAAKCWGESDGHALTSSAEYHADARTIPGLSDGVTDIDSGKYMACAIDSGAVKCWGTGALGDGTSHGFSAMVTPSGLDSGVTKIAVEGNAACAVQLGQVKCWGDVANGNPGDNSTGPALAPIVPVGLDSGVTDVALGAKSACAVVTASVKCWGNGSAGELGDGAQTTSPIPVDVPGMPDDASAVATATNVGCAIVSSVVKCWGSNENGLLGDGVGRGFDPNPQLVSTLSSGVTDISVGETLACAVAHGSGKCWGKLSWPSSGAAAGPYGAASPTVVPGLESGVDEISAAYTVCAIVTGAVRCGDSGATSTPPLTTSIPGAENDASVLRSARTMGCAVVGGAAKCFSTYSGAPGTSSVVGDLVTGVSAIETNWSTYCAIVNGGVKCWNPCTNYRIFQCENPYVPNKTPQDKVGLTSGVTDIAVSYDTVCAVVSGAAKCFGGNTNGGLGDGSLQSSSTPVQVLGLSSGVTSIETSGWKTCAVKDGDVYCWGPGGANQIEEPENASTPVPQKVSGLPGNVTRVAPGTQSSCAIAGGAAYCWGSNSYGQLGIGAPFKLRSAEPVSAPGDDPTGGFVLPGPNQVLNTDTTPVVIETANATETSCALDDGDWTPCPSSYTNLSDGGHWIHLRVKNAAGEEFKGHAHIWTNASAPVAQINAPANGSVVTTATPELDIELDDYGFETITCTLDGNTLPQVDDGRDHPCLYVENLPTLSPGVHTLVVSVKQGGDVQTTVSVFTYDPPEGEPVAEPTPPTTSAPATSPKVTAESTTEDRTNVRLRAVAIGNIKRSSGAIKFKYAIRFAIPVGLDRKVACSGGASMQAAFGTRSRTATVGRPVLIGRICRIVGAFRLPSTSLGRMVKLRFSLAGNAVIAPAHTSRSVRLKQR